ncbi:MAG: DUF4012 domain-containing protein [Candidatus Daviesbacteria bacterium]|nr:MAG: DUF4012 domain-containing protein [Candidatus Daviesbacteria bacterium]
MPETADPSNSKERILIARNTPVALVIGGAGFLGSHLVEELLKKNLQVLVVDDLSSGFKQYLTDATKNKNFHFFVENAGDFNLELPRLDYLFIVAEGGWDLTNILELAEKHHSKIVFVSSIELYNKDSASGLEWFKTGERKIAQFAADHNLNARVVRLATIYGPRMHFRNEDGLIELIKATLLGELQKHSLTQQFSTRAIFVGEAVSLIIKSMFAGSTALKIFDGAMSEPIQLTEIKQVLLDPVWYENRGFKPTELPPWNTPNLEKTIKTLNWQPDASIVKYLKSTLSYFKEAEVPIAQMTTSKPTHKISLWVDEEGPKAKEGSPLEIKEDRPIKSYGWGKQLIWVGLLILIFYALFYPFISVGVGVLNYKNRLVTASQALEKGDYETSISLVEAAQESIQSASFLISSVQVARSNGWFGEQFGLADDLIKSAQLVAEGTKEAARGAKSLYQILKIILGQDKAELADNLAGAQLQLAGADDHFSQAQAILGSDSFKKRLPAILQGRVRNLQDRLDYGQKLTGKASGIASLISSLTTANTKKSYLVVLQDQSELRPTGGLIVGLTKLDFIGGQLKTFSVLNPQDLDKKLTATVEPPRELKLDLGLKTWNLANANWEGDFPTSARQVIWFFNQETGQKIDGVAGLDVLTLKEILQVTGPVKIADSSEITSDNLIAQALSGSQYNFYSALLTGVFNKLLTPQDLNWPGVLTVMDRSLTNKNMTLYLDDTKLLSLLITQGWAGVLPRPAITKGVLKDFLATMEANLGGNKANYFVSQNRQLQTTIGSSGEIEQKLTIDYKNDSQNEVYPAGVYKNNLRFYLPFGVKVNSLYWGSEDILKLASNFSDYGRSGLSATITLAPQETKSLVINYVLPHKLEFGEKGAKYQLSLVKQSGVNYQLKWKLNYPINFQLVGEQGSAGQQETTLEMKSDQTLSATFIK